MHATENLPSSELFETELQKLSQGLKQNLFDGQTILGSKLGDIVRRYLDNPNLKGRFGGLKPLISRYFSGEIRWHGRQGLDDVYVVYFSGDANRKWEPVPLEPSTWLWPAVSNPAIDRQFAWSSAEQALVHAAPGVPVTEGVMLIAKLSRSDYVALANAFTQSMELTQAHPYVQLLKNTDALGPFISALRQDGLLANWEVFRIDHVLRIFTERLEAAGANKQAAVEWADRLRSSQQRSRVEKAKHLTIASMPVPQYTLSMKPTVRVSKQSVNNQNSISSVPDALTLALKAMEFLSASEVAELRLPLGSVISPLKVLLR